MVRRKKDQTEGEQLDLIDVSPPNSKEIIKYARIYKKAQAERQEALAREVESKQKLLSLIKEAGLKPLENGVIRFRLDGYTITVKPRDELVRVKDDSEEE